MFHKMVLVRLQAYSFACLGVPLREAQISGAAMLARLNCFNREASR